MGAVVVVLLLGVDVLAQQCPIPVSAFGFNVVIPSNDCAPFETGVFGSYSADFPAGCTVDPLSGLEFVINWGDGTERIREPVLVRPITGGTNRHAYFFGSASGDQFDISTVNTNYRHEYPRQRVVCSFQITVTLRIKGTNEIIKAEIGNMTTYHQRDDYWGAQPLVMIEPVTGETVFLVCVGQSACIRFQDVSLLNCNPAGEQSFTKNTDPRYLQFEYGTTVSVANTIPGISVAGQPYTIGRNPDGSAPANLGNRIPAANRLDGGNGMGNNTYRTIPVPVPPSTGVLTNEICVPNTTTMADVGKEFRVMLNLWNKCNPLESTPPSATDRANAATTEAIIRIVAAPPAPDNWSSTYCNRTNNSYTNAQYAVTLNHTPMPQGGTYYYFRDNGQGTGPGPVADPSNPNLNDAIWKNTNNQPTGFNPVTLFGTGSQDYLNPSNAQTKIYWVVYESTTYGTNPDEYNMICVSKPAKITYTIFEDISAMPGIPEGNMSVCPSNDLVTYTVRTSDPESRPFGGDITYVWENGDGYEIVATRNRGREADVRFLANPVAPSPAQTITIGLYRRWADTPDDFVAPSSCAANKDCNYCASAIRTFNVTVNPIPTATLSGGGTICAGGTEMLPLTISGITGAAGTATYDIVLEANNGAPDETRNGIPAGTSSVTINVNPFDGTTNTYRIRTITSQLNGCTNNAAPGSATVVKRELLTLTGPMTGPTPPVCEGSSFTVSLPSPPNPDPSGSRPLGGLTEYVWNYNGVNYPSVSPGPPGNSTTSPGMPTGAALSNTEPAVRNATVTLQYTTDAAQSSGNRRCPVSLFIPIEIRPAPTVRINAATPNSTICLGSGTSFDIDLTGTPNIPWVVAWRVDTSTEVYETIPGTATGTETYTVSILYTPYLTSVGPHTFEVRSVTQATGGGCAGTRVVPYTAEIKVLEIPTATIGGTIAICEDTSVDIPVTITGANSGDYRVDYTVSTTITPQSMIFSVPLSSPRLHIPVSLINQGTPGSSPTSTFVDIAGVTQTTIGLNGLPKECSSATTSRAEIETHRIPMPADAGTIPGVCIDIPPNRTITLNANNPSPYLGEWSIVVQPGSSHSPSSFSNINAYNSSFTITENGRFELKWTIASTSAACPSQEDILVLDFAKMPNKPNAGGDDMACSLTFQLSANAPNLSNEAGRWSAASTNPGTAEFSDPTNNRSTVTVDAYGKYTFIWELYNVCSPLGSGNIDNVTINFVERPAVNVIPTQEWCPDVPIPTVAGFPVFASSLAFPSVPGANSVFSWAFTTTETLGFAASGNGNFPNGSPRSNNTTNNLTARVRVTENNQGCTNTRDVDIILKPRPQLASVTPTTMCHNATVTFELNPMLSLPVTYNWNNSEPSIGLAATGGSPTGDVTASPFRYQFTATNTTDVPVIANITNLTATVNGCTSLPMNVALTVNPFVRLTRTDVEVCPEDNVMPGQTTVISNVANTTFTWSWAGPYIGFTVPAGAATFNAANDNVGSFSAIANDGAAPVGGTVTVTGRANNCTSTIYYDLKVKPRPVIAPISNQSLCPLPEGAAAGSATSGTFAAINFESTNFNSDITYHWTKIPPTGPTPPTKTDNPVPLTDLTFGDNVTGSVQTYTWTVTAIGDDDSPAKGCWSRPFTFYLNVNPRPRVNVNPLTQTVCSEGSHFQNITFFDNAGGISTFAWSIEEPPGITTGATGSVSGTTISGNGSPITFPNVATNSTVTSVAAMTATASITATSLAGCVGPPSTASLIVSPAPKLNQPSHIDECSDKLVPPTTFTSTGVTPESYTWFVSDPSVAKDLVDLTGPGAEFPSFTTTDNNTTTNKQAIVTVRGKIGICESTPVTFNINVRPIPKVNPVTNLTVCPGDPVNISSFSTNLTGNDASIISWTLDEPDIASPALASTGVGNIALFTAGTNDTYSPLVGTFTLTPTMVWTVAAPPGTLSCEGEPTLLKITVNPTPNVLQVTTPRDFCHNELVPPTVFTSNYPNATFSWVRTGDNIGLANTSGNGNLPGFTATNNTHQMLTAGVSSFAVTARASGCASSSSNFTIIVKPVPQLDDYDDIEICADETFPLEPFSLKPENLTYPSVTDYEWEIFDWILESGLPDGLQTGNITDTYPTFTPDTLRTTGVAHPLWGETRTNMKMTVTPTHAGCPGIPKDVYIYIKPLPITKFNKNFDKCVVSGVPSLYSTIDGAIGSTYEWDFITDPSDLNYASFAPTIPNKGLPFTGRYYEVYEYPTPVGIWAGWITVREKNVWECSGSRAHLYVKTVPAPTITLTPERYDACSGESVQLHATIETGGVIYTDEEDFPPDPNDPSLKTISFSWYPSSAGHETSLNPWYSRSNNSIDPIPFPIRLQAEVEGCVSDFKTTVLNVHSLPQSLQIDNKNYCSDTPAWEMNITASSVLAGSTIIWERIDVNAGVTLPIDNTAPNQTTVVMNSLTGGALTYTNALPGLPASLVNDETFTYHVSQVFTNTDNITCASTPSIGQMTIRISPEPPVADPIFACKDLLNGGQYMLRASTSGENTIAINWYNEDSSWAGGTAAGPGQSFWIRLGTTAESGLNTPESPGIPATYHPVEIYSVIATAANQCTSAPTTVPLTIYPPIDLDVDWLSGTIGCSPFTAEGAIKSPSQFYTYEWTWEAGVTRPVPSGGIASYQYQTAATSTLPESAWPRLSAESLPTSPFKNSITGELCTSSELYMLIVAPGVKADFIPDFSEGCSPVNVFFTNRSSNAYRYRWYWNRQDNEPPYPGHPTNPGPIENVNNAPDNLNYGTIAPNPLYSFTNTTANPITYRVWLQVDNDYCFANKSGEITVYPVPNVDLKHNLSSGNSICPPLPVEFTNLSSGSTNSANTRYVWNFADGEVTPPIPFDPNPVPHYYESYNASAPIPYMITLTAMNTFTFPDPDKDDLVCLSSLPLHINVNPQVKADFSGDDNGCSPASARFQSQSLGAVSYYQWDFGDNTPIETGSSPTHLYVNNITHDEVKDYTITLTAGNSFGCKDIATRTYQLNPQPLASFVADKTSGCQPLKVTFTNTSNETAYPNPATNMTYTFDFRDGDARVMTTTDTVQHAFINTMGTNLLVYPIMTAENEWGCKFTTPPITITLFPYVNAHFDMEDSIGCAPLNIRFRNGSSGYTSYMYSFGDGVNLSGTRSSNILSTHSYINPSMYRDTTYYVTLSVSSGQCSDAVTKAVTVYGTPVADFRPGSPWPADIPFPAPPIMIDNLMPFPDRDHLNYLWSWTEQNSGYVTNFSSAIYPSPIRIADWGKFDITQRVVNVDRITSAVKCSDIKTLTISIVPPAVVPYFEEVPPDCMPYQVQFINGSKYAIAYRWDFGDNYSSNQEHPKHTYTDAGTYEVRLTATGDNLDQQTYSRFITVYPVPQASFHIPLDFVWAGQPIRPNNYTPTTTSAGVPFGVWYEWDWGDNSPKDTTTNPSHIYYKAGSYSITLTAGTYTDPVCVTSITKSNAIDIEKSGDVIMPNVFKPKPSGEPSPVIPGHGYKNDLFYPPALSPVKKYHFLIVNRWGQLIFETNDTNVGWNGYFKGQLCPEGVYMYRIEGVFETGQSFLRLGNVTLLR